MSAAVQDRGVATHDVEARVQTAEWSAIAAGLDGQGWAVLPNLLTRPECEETAGLYAGDGHFRSRVIMARHGFGRGEYQYFAYPLPELVAALRSTLYARLAPVANRWNATMGMAARFPDEHSAFLDRCLAAGQTRPTPLLLQYGPDDYNCLHQDLYGEHVFPLQVAILLSEPGEEFEGGEFVLTEQRPRMQSRPVRGATAPGRRRGLRGEPAAGAGLARLLSHGAAPRGQQNPLGAAAHGRHHLPRCCLSRSGDAGPLRGGAA